MGLQPTSDLGSCSFQQDFGCSCEKLKGQRTGKSQRPVSQRAELQAECNPNALWRHRWLWWGVGGAGSFWSFRHVLTLQAFSIFHSLIDYCLSWNSKDKLEISQGKSRKKNLLAKDTLQRGLHREMLQGIAGFGSDPGHGLVQAITLALPLLAYWKWHGMFRFSDLIPSIWVPHICYMTIGQSHSSPQHQYRHLSNAIVITTWWDLTKVNNIKCPEKC